MAKSKRRSRRTGGRSRVNMRTNRSRVIPHPPQINSTITFSKRFRFQSNAAATSNITAENIFDLLVMAASAVTAFDLIQSFRLRSVEMWGPMAAALTPVTVSCVFPNFGNGLSGSVKEYSDQSMGSTECAHVLARPVARSVQSFWQGTPAATTFMTLTYPVGCVIDITLDMVLANGIGSVVPRGSAPVGATTGQVYLTGLDGAAAAGTKLPPVSYDTI